MSDERPPDSHEGDDVHAATDPDRTTDAVDRTDRDAEAAATGRDAQAGDPSDERRGDADPDPASGSGAGDDGGGLSDRVAFWLSALIGLVLAFGAVALVSGRAPLFEDVLRVRPSVEGGGVGADWIVGNTEPVLEALIAIVHFADVVLGIFILVMVFVHWAAFRRLAARMQPPDARARTQETAAATDGGTGQCERDGDTGQHGPDEQSREDGAPSRGGDPS
ncbi:hypothetical protein [Natronorubrum sp. FCH18a]|uniref:hypothetical protein n=1 Tax=Natronorubrum sp. FCH18a TaxID=3447018 RepID=UPI003F5114C0